MRPSFAAATILLFVGACDADPPLPSLVNGLPKDNNVANEVFDARVKHRFPTGTTEAALVGDLKAQGFREIVDFEQNRFAEFEQSNFLCGRKWVVVWKTGQDGLVSEVAGHDNLTCL
jgi:hypothetical protein